MLGKRGSDRIMLDSAMYRCDVCKTTWQGELPPLWTAMDLWPLHCGIPASLVEVRELAVPLPQDQMEAD